MARVASSAALISMRWFVDLASKPDAQAPSGIAQAQPPGPGFPRQAPSVYAVVSDDVTGGIYRPPRTRSATAPLTPLDFMTAP